MQILLNTSNSERLQAAFIFFTRLPFWRIWNPSKDAYKSVVEYWPLTGWLTAAVMAATLYFTAIVLPYPVAVGLAICSRILITGALHEDGLADFFDGFGGGGTDRQRILDIMKDSHIGTYGVLALMLYLLLLFLALTSMSADVAALTILAADPYAKMISAQTILIMPYARKEEEAKNKTVYRRFDFKAGIGLAVQGLLPLGTYIYIMYAGNWQMLLFVPCIVMYFLYLLIWHRLRGYTGDCCGTIFLLTELSIYITVCAN